MYLYVCTHMYRLSCRKEEFIASPRVRGTGDCELPDMDSKN